MRSSSQVSSCYYCIQDFVYSQCKLCFVVPFQKFQTFQQYYSEYFRFRLHISVQSSRGPSFNRPPIWRSLDSHTCFFIFSFLVIWRCRHFRGLLFVWRVRRTFFPSGSCFSTLWPRTGCLTSCENSTNQSYQYFVFVECEQTVTIINTVECCLLIYCLLTLLINTTVY